MASPVISPLLTWASNAKLKNWAGNLEYSTDQLYSANSLDQVRSYVKQQPQLKVLGTRHCFNNIADSTHSLLSLKSMDQVVRLDSEAHCVTVNAGMTYGQLCPYLHDKGFALHNLASLPHIGKHVPTAFKYGNFGYPDCWPTFEVKEIPHETSAA
jgi:xylitol oxidase